MFTYKYYEEGNEKSTMQDNDGKLFEVANSWMSDPRNIYEVNGKICETDDYIKILGHSIIEQIPFKGMACNQISLHFKKLFGEKNGLPTDYVEVPNLLYNILGFTTTDIGRLCYSKKLFIFPFEVVVQKMPADDVVTAFRNMGKEYSDKALSEVNNKHMLVISYPQSPLKCHSLMAKNNEIINIIEDWLVLENFVFIEDDDSIRVTYNEDMNEFCREAAKLMDVQFAYSNEDEFWHSACEIMNLYTASEYYSLIVDISDFLYEFLSKEYKELGMLLVNTKFQFGIDDDGKLYVVGQLGSPDVSRLIYLDAFEKDNEIISVDRREDIMKFYSEKGYQLGSIQRSPALPKWIVKDISSAYLKIAEKFCGKRTIKNFIKP